MTVCRLGFTLTSDFRFGIFRRADWPADRRSRRQLAEFIEMRAVLIVLWTLRQLTNKTVMFLTLSFKYSKSYLVQGNLKCIALFIWNFFKMCVLVKTKSRISVLFVFWVCAYGFRRTPAGTLALIPPFMRK